MSSDIVCKLSKVTLNGYNCAICCCFQPLVVQICFFTAAALLLKSSILCIGIFIGNLPETPVIFYWHFIGILWKSWTQ